MSSGIVLIRHRNAWKDSLAQKPTYESSFDHERRRLALSVSPRSGCFIRRPEGTEIVRTSSRIATISVFRCTVSWILGIENWPRNVSHEVRHGQFGYPPRSPKFYLSISIEFSLAEPLQTFEACWKYFCRTFWDFLTCSECISAVLV